MGELSQERREALARANEHGPEVCDCNAYAPDNGYPDDLICEGLAETFRLVAAWSTQDHAEALREAAERALRDVDDVPEDVAAGLYMTIRHGGDTGVDTDWREAYRVARCTRALTLDADR